MLIRGAAGSGKSRLALRLLQAAANGQVAFARLVADDRTLLRAFGGRLLAWPVPELAGRIEVRGLGVRAVPHEPVAVVGLAVDLGADAGRLPDPAAVAIVLESIQVPRVAVPAGSDPLPLVLAAVAGDMASQPP